MPQPAAQTARHPEPVSLVEMLARLEAREQHGLLFIHGANQEDRVSYARLLADARRMLTRLQARGLAPGQELVIQTGDNRALLTIFWACVLGGLVPVPLAPARQAENRRKLWGVWPRLTQPWLAVDAEHWEHLSRHDPSEAEAIAERVISVETLGADLEGEDQARDLAAPPPEALALVQFSSGSTGRPKGVRLTHANLLSNLRGMTQGAAMTAADSFFGWMPLTHDMGLIAFHLWPTYLGVDQFILDTPLFIRRPGLWLAKASQHRATVLGSPDFGYQLLLASLRTGQRPDWDLSAVRILFNAAEPISPKVCDRFMKALAPCGLTRQAMFPCYGLAETAVGAAFPPPGRAFARVHLDRDTLTLGDQARELPPEHPQAATFAVEGHPLVGTDIAIRDDQGRDLPEGRLGRVMLRGPSVTAGYHGDPEATAQAVSRDGWLDTGDLGLVLRGQLVITGRIKDVIFSRGQNFFSHDLERVAEATPGLGPGKALAVGLTTPERQAEEVVVFLRHRSRELGGFAILAERVAEAIARDLGLAVDHVLPVEVIPKTTSGKLRRYLLRQRYLLGEFAAQARALAELRSALRASNPTGADAETVPIPPALAALWAQVLEQSDPPSGASFFALGGDSLRATRLVERAREELGAPVTLADLLEHSSLAAFATHLTTLGGASGALVLSPAPAQTYHPATPNQRRLHALQATQPESTAYNLPLALRLRGELDPRTLERALTALVALHEPLRTGLEVVDGQVVQRVHPAAAYHLALPPWPAGVPLADPEALGRVLRPWLRPFDLARPPLLRATLLQPGPGEHVLLLDLHHALVDGGSLPRLLADLGRLYAGQSLPAPGLQFKDHAHWLAGQEHDQATSLTFWREHLGPELPRLELPLLEARQPWRDQAGHTLFHDLSPELSADLERLAGDLEVTPNLMLLAAFGILLGRHADQEDLVLGAVAAGREHPGCADMVGMFVNTLPLRARPEAGKTLAGFLAELRAGLAGALRHQDHPLEDLPAQLDLVRQPGREPLFDVMFAPEEFDLTGLAWPGLELELLDFSPGTAKFDLTLFARPTAKGYRLWLEYASALFEREAMEALLRRYETLLVHMARGGGGILLRDLEILPPDERRRLLVDFNATAASYPSAGTLHQLIAQTARARPEAVALEEADGARGQLTYGELERSANRLAWQLRQKGLVPGQMAAILSPRCIPLMVGILASLKAGGAYLPLEPDQPAQRLGQVLADSGARLLLLGPGQAPPPDLPPGLEALRLDELLAQPGREDSPPPLAGPDDLAYVIYTSGSTGAPKGVMIPHRAALNYLCWAVRVYLGDRPGDFPLFTSLAFDLTVTSLFAPLISGGRVVIHGEADPASLVSLVVAQDRVDVLKLTPAHLAILREDCPPNARLKVMIVGGEDLKAELARDIWQRFGGRVAICNEYGPTETTVGCMIHSFDPEQDRRTSVPIGRPAANTALYVLDRHLRPLPEGAVGELYIAGDGLARGYHQRSELTAQRFPQNPFASGQRMYQSGDRVRFLTSGVLEYLGRGDQQIKLHGMRIEPGEIEARLKRHPDVSEAAVVLRAGDPGGPRLVGYFTSPGAAPEPAALLAWLAQTLPRAMLPSALVPLERLPLTTNGKLDREALPAPLYQGGAEHQPPRNPREADLCAVFGQVLGRESLGVQDNFFDLGGDSIKAVQIVSRLAARGWRSTAGEILRFQTVAALAPRLEALAPEISAASTPDGPWGELPMAAWLSRHALAQPGHYHQSVLLECRQPLDPGLLASALAAVVDHHPGLRLNRDSVTGLLFVNTAHTGRDFGPTRLDAPSLDAAAPLLARFKSGWDLAREPLFRAALIETPQAPSRLLLCAHHLLVDLVSWSLILEELTEAYRALEQGRAPRLPPAGPPPAPWVAALRRHYQSPAGLAELPHWQATLATEFRLPRALEPASWRMRDCAVLVQELDAETSARLTARAREDHGADPSILVLTALAGALARWTGRERVVIETEGHGRHLEALVDAPDPTRGLGWYTAMHPLALRLEGDDPAAWLAEVKRQMADTPQQGVGFGVLRYLLERPELANAPERPPVRFNYLGAVDRLLGNDLFRYRPADTGPDIAPENAMTCELEVIAMLVEGRLRLRLTHHALAQPLADIHRLADTIGQNLRTLLGKPSRGEAAKPRPEDYDAAGLSAADLGELF